MHHALRVAMSCVAAFLLIIGTMVSAPDAVADDVAADPAATAADAALPDTVSADALPTVQIDGVVWTQAVAGDVVYAGGEFSNARPAGAAPGTNLTPRKNALAYQLSTGNLIPSWNYSFNGAVKDMAVSPDQKRLYVVGNFTQVNGQTRNRIAVFDLPSGALSTTVVPSITGGTGAVAATNTTIYVGGYFGSVNGIARSRIAAINATNGSLRTNFTVPVDDGQVQSLTVSPQHNKLVVAGSFTSVGGSNNPGFGMYLADATTGAGLPMPVNSVVRNGGVNAAILGVSSDADRFYGVGYHFSGTGNSEGTFAANWSDGSLVWLEDCHGDTYDVAPAGATVYTASHKHYCGNSGGFPQTEPWGFYHSNAWTNDVRGTNTGDIYGYPDHPGTPRPELLNWFPVATIGSYTKKNQATWNVVTSGDYVLYGGEFPRINGVGQQGLVRYVAKSKAPNKQGPTNSGASINPTARSLVPGQVRLTWPGNVDRDDSALTYRIYRDTQTDAGIVHQSVQDAPFWRVQSMQFTDSGLTPGTTVRYRLRVSDGSGNAAWSEWVSVQVTNADSLGAYGTDVLADGATKYWRLGESDASVYDYAGVDDTTAAAGVTRGTGGAVLGSTDTASTFDGSSNGAVISKTAVTGPDTFSTEVWFKTTTTSGGKILGFGNASTGSSNNYDRHVFMDRSGKVAFGVYPGAERTIRSATAYNDGQWHQAVASLGAGGMTLSIDGRRVASRADVTGGQPYSGYWRIGGDNSWEDTGYFSGSIDEFSVYPTELTPQQVNSHWMSSGRRSALNTAPGDAYGASVFGDSPDLYWRLGDTTGSTAADSAPSGAPGSYFGNVSMGRPGAVPSNSAIGVSGSQFSQGGNVVSQRLVNNPLTFSQEVWINTTTTTGGRIFGFGDSPTGSTSSNYDRHLWMLDDGRVQFGVWTGQASIVASTSALNDGRWHHVVSTLGPNGMQLIVDGQVQSTHPNTTAQPYSGYWKLGGDNAWGGNSDMYFTGDLDEAAVYPRVLSLAEVQDHYLAGGGQLPNAVPEARFTVEKAGLSVRFDGSSSSDADGSVASYAWQFGDGERGTGVTPSHEFAADGTYQVTLTITDNRGATGTTIVPVTVQAPNQAPEVSFEAVVNGNDVAFTSDAQDRDGSITGYRWQFGDGTTSDVAAPRHSYSGPGRYDVVLTVTDDEGAEATVTKAITIQPPNTAPVATFTAAASGLSVALDGSASADADGTVASWAWTFGDGSTGTGRTVTHDYTKAGTYEVQLRVTDDDGAVHAATRSVTVTAPAASDRLAADSFERTVAAGWGTADQGGAWSAQPSAGSRLSVASGAGVMALGTGTSTATLPQVSSQSSRTDAVFSVDKLYEATYVSVIGRRVGSAEYYARLRLQTDGGLRLNILRNPGTSLIGSTFTPDLRIVPGEKYVLSMEVTGTAPTAVKTKVWKLGTTEPDWQRTGVDSTAALQAPGSVGLTNFLPAGAAGIAPVNVRYDSVTVTDPSVQVTDPEPENVSPVAAFSSTVDALSVALDASGSSDSDGTVASYAWTFGDGTSGTGRTVSHDFAEPGTYQVRLTVTDDDGATNAVTKAVTVADDSEPVNAAPVAAFSSSVDALSVTLDGSGSSDSDGAIASYAWAFGDGASGTGQSVSHDYTEPGSYQVRLTVTDDDGATHALTKAVTVTQAGTSDRVASDDFNRSVANGWGSADAGGSWTLTAGGSSKFSVSSGNGVLALAPGTSSATLSQVSSQSSRVDATFTVDKLYEATYVSVVGRKVGGAEYFTRLRLQTDGGVRMNVLRGPGPTLIGSAYTPDLTIVPGEKYVLSMEVTGTAPTTVRAKVWKLGTAEPDWQRTGTDSTAALQGPGAVGVSAYLPGGAAGIAPVTLRLDSFAVTDPTGQGGN